MLVIIPALFLLIVSTAVLAGKVPWLVLGVYVVASVITFISYALDKSASTRKGARRTPESTLHVLSLLGGWPGALIAQHKLRHKTRKQPFRLILWLMIILNFAVFFWLLASSAGYTFRGLIAGVM
ncbi:MAG: DUF1294 domain-containing protein [Idiomarina sp.]|nr:DUF1294 domain-containing protein [Idiomarina sp.]